MTVGTVPHCTRDVTPGPSSATDTYIVYHVTHFEASRNVILHTRYVSTYCCYAYHFFARIGGTLLTCDMYMSDLRHIHDPVLSSLKMEGIRLLSVLIRHNQ
jgi:hypothetical protein